MWRFCAQYSMIATPREASGPGCGTYTVIFALGSSIVSGITEAGAQFSRMLCAAAVIANNRIPVSHNRDAIFATALLELTIFSSVIASFTERGNCRLPLHKRKTNRKKIVVVLDCKKPRHRPMYKKESLYHRGSPAALRNG